MGRIISAYIVPHPPILLPEVGKGEEVKAKLTAKAYIKAAADIANDKPSTIVITTPHAPMFQDFIYISQDELLYGDFAKFGAKQVRMEFPNNLNLMSALVKKANQQGIPCGGLEDSILRRYNLEKKLDHGATVPLYFIQKQYQNFKLLHISTAGLPFRELYRFGMLIAETVQESDEKVVFVASGDLSHRLLEEGNYGFNKNGPIFDNLLVESVRNNLPEELLLLDEGFCESAGECGLRSFIMMYGAFDLCSTESEIYSYEGPFGVGYAVARIKPLSDRKSLLNFIDIKIREKAQAVMEAEDPYTALARRTVEEYVRTHKIVKANDDLPAEMLKNKAGVFVSIKMNGRLRGCIGTTSSTRENIASEIINNAISASTRDPRFDAVEPEELEKLSYSVDVLQEAEQIKSFDELDLSRYGVIVTSGNRRGLLLPDLEGVDTVREQVDIALKKAGIKPDAEYTMERFEVIRHK